jgi:hypothetical protein
VALDGIQLVWLAAGDITKILGVPFQYELSIPNILISVEEGQLLTQSGFVFGQYRRSDTIGLLRPGLASAAPCKR